jgi:hypothetical protein
MGISERFGLPGDRLGDHRMSMTQTRHGSPAASIDKPPAIGRDKLDPATAHHHGHCGARRAMENMISHAWSSYEPDE